jgi:CubicO group peptidase (beta-lactamase class C family)
MTDAIAAQAPMFRPHIDSAYQSMTFGWIVGEIVQRVDPAGRDIGRFVREEIAGPLGITDLWIGLPASEEPRMAMMDGSAVYDFPDGTPYRAACPRQVDLMPEPFGRSRVRRAIIPAVGGIFNARSGARFFAMLANGGELDGVRLLSEQSVAALSEPRERASQPDPVFFGMVIPMGSGGFWLGSDSPPTAAPRNPKAICHPGMGGAIGWADPDRALAVMYCRNRLYNPTGPEDDNATMIADVIRELVNAS